MPYHVFGERSGAFCLMSACSRSAMTRSASGISAIFASTSLSHSAFVLAAFSSRARSFIAARSAAENVSFCAGFLSAIALHLRGLAQPLEQRVDTGEAAPRALLHAVLHRGVAFLRRREAHRLRQSCPVAQILELQGLEVVLEGLHEPRGRLDLAELALDRAVCGAEPIRASGTDVHLLDDGTVAPPLGNQIAIGPDGEDVLARRVEDPLDADLAAVRGGDGRALHRAPFVRSTTCAKRSSRCSQVLMPSKAYGTSVQLRTRPTFSVVTSCASSSTLTCFFIPVNDIPKGSASSLIVALPAPSRSRTARRVGSPRAAKARSVVVLY